MLERGTLSALVLLGLFVVTERASAAAQVTVTSLGPTSPSVLRVGTPVEVTFDYVALEQNPRIVAIPYTQGVPTPEDSTHTDTLSGSSGSGTCTFTILGGIVNVDALHLEMRSDTEPDSLLFSTILPVSYAFNAKGSVYDLSFDPPSVGAMMEFGDYVHVAFSYETSEAQGVRIFFQPYAGYAAAPSSAYGPSVTLPAGSGVGQSYFTLTSEPAIVDRVRVQMWRANLSVLLVEAYLPVSYVFGVPTTNEPLSWGRLKAKRW